MKSPSEDFHDRFAAAIPQGIADGIRAGSDQMTAALVGAMARREPVQPKTARPTLDEIRAWPATVDIPAAAQALGISRSYGFELAKQGAFPCKVITVGKRIRVITASLIELLSPDD